MKKFYITLSLLTALIFTAESVHAQENADETITLEESLDAEQQPASVPIRPSKIWIDDVSLPYTGVTHFYERRMRGAIYRGTLDLKPGVYFGGSGIYRGYVYNTQLGPYPIKLDMLIE